MALSEPCRTSPAILPFRPADAKPGHSADSLGSQAPAEGSCSSWSGLRGPSRPLRLQMLEHLPTSLWADSPLLSAGGSPLSCESSPSSAQQNGPFPLAGTLVTSCWSSSLCCPQRGPCPSPCLVGPCQEGLGSEPGFPHL